MERASDRLGAPKVTPEQWEQRRYEIARDILAASYVANDTLGNCYRDMIADLMQDLDNAIEAGECSKFRVKVEVESIEPPRSDGMDDRHGEA